MPPIRSEQMTSRTTRRPYRVLCKTRVCKCCHVKKCLVYRSSHYGRFIVNASLRFRHSAITSQSMVRPWQLMIAIRHYREVIWQTVTHSHHFPTFPFPLPFPSPLPFLTSLSLTGPPRKPAPSPSTCLSYPSNSHQKF